VRDDEVLFSSEKKGLRPLVECISEMKGKVDDAILYDRAIGLAAAKLIVYSGFIIRVITPLMSKKAKVFLDDNKIETEYEKIVDTILNSDKTDSCPMEKKAEDKDFIGFIFSRLRPEQQ